MSTAKKNTGRPDKLHLLPAFLDALVTTPTISVAAQRVGLSASSVMRYLVRSRLGDPALQEIEWMTVRAPFHQHVTMNARALPLSLCRVPRRSRAQRSYQGVFYQGSEND